MIRFSTDFKKGVLKSVFCVCDYSDITKPILVSITFEGILPPKGKK